MFSLAEEMVQSNGRWRYSSARRWPNFKTAALNHSATLPAVEIIMIFCSRQDPRGRFATLLLPFCVAVPLQCVGNQGINAGCCLTQHARQHVAVEVQCNADLAMPQALYASAQQGERVRDRETVT